MDKKIRDQRLSVHDAARRAGRNPETIRRWIWSGKLSAEKLGNQLFVRASDFEIYCREMAARPYSAVKPTADAYSGTSSSKRVGKKKEEIEAIFERMKELRERIRARMGRDFTEEEIVDSIRELREGRDVDVFGLR